MDNLYYKDSSWRKASKKKSYISIVTLVIVLFFIALLALLFFKIKIAFNNFSNSSLDNLYIELNDKQYETVYEKTKNLLIKKPLDVHILALHGFSSYYLSVEQSSSTISRDLLNESINSLRNAWYRIHDSEKPQIAYILGKAYYQKGYYYADLALKFLNISSNSKYHYEDLDEFRGLTALLLGDYQQSNDFFISSLSKKQSDLMLYSVSQNFFKMTDYEKSKQYLFEVLRLSLDDYLIIKAQNDLANIYILEKDFSLAYDEYQKILGKDPNNADAHYGLGVIYESQGDLVKARSEWRKSIKINPAHKEARIKLNI